MSTSTVPLVVRGSVAPVVPVAGVARAMRFRWPSSAGRGPVDDVPFA